MKKGSIIVLPIVIVILLLAGVFVWKAITPPATLTQTGALPNNWNGSTGSKPKNPFSFLFNAGPTPIPTPTPASAAAMNADLQTIGDDGGASDFSSLTSQANGL